jgi:hypothetical protein
MVFVMVLTHTPEKTALEIKDFSRLFTIEWRARLVLAGTRRHQITYKSL